MLNKAIKIFSEIMKFKDFIIDNLMRERSVSYYKQE
jgi:hypothetical protein